MAILATEKVLTLDYWKPASKIQVGDYLFDKNGKPVKVKLVQEYRSEECYQVTFNDHLTVSGDRHLGFLAENKVYRNRTYLYKNKRKFKKLLYFNNVEYLLTKPLKDKRGRLEYSIPTTKPLEFPHQTLPVPPFLFGYWFFAKLSNKRYSVPKGYAKVVHEEFKNHGYEIVERWTLDNGEKDFSVHPTIESHLVPNIPNKIPNNYLMADTEQRIALLRGILHAKSRQYNKAKDKFRFTSKHYAIILQIIGLLESLGHRTTYFFDNTLKNYVLSFKSRLKLMENQEPKPIKVHHARRYIKAIEKIQPQTCVYIKTEGDDNSFLVGEGFISVC